jgi:hypothetical protein
MNQPATSKATIAGVLDIIAGVMSLIGAGVLFLLGIVGTGAITAAGAQDPEAARVAFVPLAFFGPISLICLTIGVAAIAGGLAAMRRQKMWLAVVGSIAALFSFFPLGIASIILTIMAEKEFDRA